MKQAVIAVGLVLILSFIISGGFSVKNSDDPIPSPVPIIGDLIGEGNLSNNEKALQLRDLKFTNRSPLPVTAPTAQPSSQPSSQPSASPATGCQNQPIAVDMLIDTSGSMCYPSLLGSPCRNPQSTSKIFTLRSAVLSFMQNLHPDDVIGMQEFADSVANLVTPGLVSDNEGTVNTKMQDLWATGFTHTRDGLTYARQQINARKSAFPNYTWVLIFLSDGIPESLGSFPDESQNPLHTPNIAEQIKQDGTRIISIGLNLDFYTIPSQYAYAVDLMTRVASAPTDFYDSPSATQLAQVYQDIADTICR